MQTVFPANARRGAPDARPAPPRYKRNLLIQRVARAPWWLLLIAALIGLFVYVTADDPVYRRVFREVREGIGITVLVTVVAYIIAVLLGLGVTLLRRTRNPLVYQLATLYVEGLRGIPTLVLVYFIALGAVPGFINWLNGAGEWLVNNGQLLSLGTALASIEARDVHPIWRAVIGLALSYSAFLSEIFRAGLESIDHGQREAGISLGMSRRQVLRLVVLPQAFRNVLPPLANDFIAMLKESSLVSLVGVNDITRQGATFASANFVFFESYSVLALTYLVMTLSLAMLVKGMEVVLYRGRHKTP